MRPVAVTPDNEALLARLDRIEAQVRALYVLIVWLVKEKA